MVSKAKILVVDDELLIRWALHESLTQAGYTVLEAPDGETACQLLAEHPDVVILDLKLGDCCGLDLLERFKRKQPQCRIILMTAFGTEETLAAARSGGAFEVVEKPFEIEQMLRLAAAAATVAA